MLGEAQLHARALTWLRRYTYRGTDGPGTLLHDVLSHMLATLLFFGSKAHAIVLHRKGPVLAFFHDQLYEIGPGVFAHI